MNLRDLLGWAKTITGSEREAVSHFEKAFAVKASSQTDPGRREENEDNCAVRIPCEGEPAFARGWLAMVSDGMGGHNAGGLASRLAVDCVVKEYYQNPDPPARSLRSAVFSANRCIRKEARRDKRNSGMGATCTVLVGLGERALLAHVGDSRLYLLRDGQISQLTEDHSAARQLECHGFSPYEARALEGRSVVLRALGAERDLALEEWDAPLALQAGDRFILCTDGLSNVLTDEDIRSTAWETDCEVACQALMALAEERQAADNVTIVVLDVSAPSSDAIGMQREHEEVREPAPAENARAETPAQESSNPASNVGKCEVIL